MIRPCFLVVDREYAGSISTRKLVIETAKFNVITAYSGEEACQALRMFPAVSGIVLDGGIRDIPHDELVHRLKEIEPKTPIVVIHSYGQQLSTEAEYHLDSFEPARLLELLKQIKPQEAAEIEIRNEKLSSESVPQ